MASRGMVVTGLLLAGGITAAFFGGHRTAGRSTELKQMTASSRSGSTALAALPVAVREGPAQQRSTPVPQSSPASLREQLRKSRDYAALVGDLSAAAAAGNLEAQYVSARALRYCDENLGRFFRLPDGKIRSLSEAQSRWANRPAGYQAQIVDIYDRCHKFLEDPGNAPTTLSWKSLLERAAEGGYPAAESEKADILRVDALLNGGVIKSDMGGKPLTLDDARTLAVDGAESGDPDALMSMSNWVDSNSHTREEYENRVSAWQIVGCQHGYGCDRTSEWLRSLCDYDPQCADGDTYLDYFRRHLGSRFDEVQSLANQIGTAIASGDSTAIRSYL